MRGPRRGRAGEARGGGPCRRIRQGGGGCLSRLGWAAVWAAAVASRGGLARAAEPVGLCTCANEAGARARWGGSKRASVTVAAWAAAGVGRDLRLEPADADRRLRHGQRLHTAGVIG